MDPSTASSVSLCARATTNSLRTTSSCRRGRGTWCWSRRTWRRCRTTTHLRRILVPKPCLRLALAVTSLLLRIPCCTRAALESAHGDLECSEGMTRVDHVKGAEVAWIPVGIVSGVASIRSGNDDRGCESLSVAAHVLCILGVAGRTGRHICVCCCCCC